MRVGNRGQQYHQIDLNAIKPLLRAYALGYATVTGPRLFSLLKIIGRKDKSSQQKFQLLCYILKTSTQWNRFPAVCALIVAGSTLLPRLIVAALHRLATRVGRKPLSLDWETYIPLIRFISTFASAWLGFQLINSRRISASHSKNTPTPKSDPPLNRLAVSGTSSPLLRPADPQAQDDLRTYLQPQFAGKTIDLTLLAFTRACDVIVGSLWQNWSQHRQRSGKYTRPERAIASLTDAGIFSISSSIIMWAWFYLPDRLPRTYNIWISEAAQIDHRLIEVLRLARQGKWLYGKDTGLANVCSSLCTDLGLPAEWGDPAKTIPLPCHCVHLRSGPNCEYHALSRFLRTFRFAISTYLPLQLFLRLRNTHNPKSGDKAPLTFRLLSTLRSSSRSSSFLALFVTLFYYSVCLSRTRIPQLISFLRRQPISIAFRQQIDSGLCVLAGCLTCGWSILLESPSRRQEIASFVLPRALVTLLPRRYKRENMWREGVVFAGSMAIVLTSVMETRGRVRGVLGRVLGEVLRA